MNKVVSQVLKHLAREFINHPEVRATAKKLAEGGYTKAFQLVNEWGSKKKLKVVPSVPAEATKKKPARKTAKKKP